MAIKNLEDLYQNQLTDIYAACKNAMPVITEMARDAQTPALAEALIDANRGIARDIDLIGDLLAAHKLDPASASSKPMEALVVEARARAVQAEFADSDTRDASVISQYQRMAHYAIAGYGCLRSFAARLGFADDVAVLQDCLNRTKHSDLRLTELAEAQINPGAADG